MKKLFLFFLLLSVKAWCQFIATYSFTGVNNSSGVVDPSPSPVVPGTAFGQFRAIGVSANSSASGRFAFTDWPVGATDGVDDHTLFAGVLSGLSYYEVKIHVLPSYTLHIDELYFGMRRSGTGPRQFSVRGDRENFSFDLSASTGTNSRLSVLPGNIFFWKFDSVNVSSDQKGSSVTPGASYQNITDSVCFRIYAWNAEAGGGSFSIDNFSVSGRIQDTVKKTSLFIPDKDISPKISLNYADGYCTISIRELDDIQQLYVSEPGGKMVPCERLPTGNFIFCSRDLSVFLLRVATGKSIVSSKYFVPKN